MDGYEEDEARFMVLKGITKLFEAWKAKKA